MARSHFHGFRTSVQTFRFTLLTTCSEGTAFRKIDGTRDISLKDDPLFLMPGIRNRNGRKKRLCIRMHRRLIKHFLGSRFYNEAKVHNSNPVRNHFYNRKVMRNENVGQIKFFLQMMKKVQHLCLDGNVQCGNGLVSNDELGFYSQSSGDTDSLFLSA